MATTLDSALAYYDSPPYANEGYTVETNSLGKLLKNDPLGDIPGLGKLFNTGGLISAFGKDKKPKTPQWKRIANREWAQGNAVLSAYERLFPRTLAMVARSKNDFGDLELDLFNKYGSKYVGAIDAADPEQGAMRREFTSNVLTDLRTPGITPSIARETAQGSRAAWSARGLANSPASAIDELFALGERGNRMQQQKYQNAANALASNKALVGDPFLAITGRSSTTQQPNYAGFNDDLFSYGVNREMQSRELRAARSAANKAMAGQIIGGALGAAGSFGMG